MEYPVSEQSSAYFQARMQRVGADEPTFFGHLRVLEI